MLETIRTNKLVNIMVWVICLLLGALWYVTRHDFILYVGVGAGLYWALFWWLHVVAYGKRRKDVSAAKKAARKELWDSGRGAREPLRKRLLKLSQMELVRDTLKLNRNHSLYAMLTGIYLTATDLLFAIYFVPHWFIWIAVGVCALYALFELVCLVYFSLELRKLSRDLFADYVDEKEREAKTALALGAIVTAANKLGSNKLSSNLPLLDVDKDYFSPIGPEMEPDFWTRITDTPPSNVNYALARMDEVLESTRVRKEDIETDVDLSGIEHEDD